MVLILRPLLASIPITTHTITIIITQLKKIILDACIVDRINGHLMRTLKDYSVSMASITKAVHRDFYDR